MPLLTEEQFLRAMPYAKSRVGKFLGPMNDAMEQFEINTPLRIGHFLGQLAIESVSLTAMEEYASGAAYDKRVDLGNTEPEAVEIATKHGSSPGRWWKGRSPIMITGYYNYMWFGVKIGADLLNDPKAICEPEKGCLVAAAFWRNAPLRAPYSLATRPQSDRLNAWLEWPRVDLNEYADKDDGFAISGIINAGNPKYPANHLKERLSASAAAVKGLL